MGFAYSLPMHKEWAVSRVAMSYKNIIVVVFPKWSVKTIENGAEMVRVFACIGCGDGRLVEVAKSKNSPLFYGRIASSNGLNKMAN